MNRVQKKNSTRSQRRHSVRGHLRAVTSAPRLSVFRSNTNMYVQIIDDTKGATVASARLSEIKATKVKEPGARIERAKALGELIAERAAKAGVKKVVFDRGNYAYHGRVQALADGARSKGLVF
mgnify:CR=1 FL=1